MSIEINEGNCPFCNPDPAKVVHEGQNWLILRDSFPVSPGHSLVVPKLHVPTLWGLPEWMRGEALRMVEHARAKLLIRHGACGFNIGINEGAVGGQSVPHVHIHVIPRYPGDREDPRGGVRWVIPEKARYW